MAELTTIDQHWINFLARDIPPNAPSVQVHAMRTAFAAGAASAMHLVCQAMEEGNLAESLAAHLEGIKTLVKPHG